MTGVIVALCVIAKRAALPARTGADFRGRRSVSAYAPRSIRSSSSVNDRTTKSAAAITAGRCVNPV